MSAAPETGTRISIDEDVDLLDEQIQALTELGQKEPADDADIYDLSIRWGAALAGRLRRLVHYSSLGLLDEPTSAGSNRCVTNCARRQR